MNIYGEKLTELRKNFKSLSYELSTLAIELASDPEDNDIPLKILLLKESLQDTRMAYEQEYTRWFHSLNEQKGDGYDQLH